MEDNKLHLSLEQFESGEDTSYSPVIQDLTPKQIKMLKIKKRLRYVLKILNYLFL